MEIVSYLMGQKSSSGGTTNYSDLSNKPSINNVELSGNKTTSDLNISYNDLEDKPTIPDIIQYSEMLTASADNLGKIVQFVGTTTNDYTNGYFYKCVEDNNTYSWQNIEVQGGASGGGNVTFETVFTYTGTGYGTDQNIPITNISQYDYLLIQYAHIRDSDWGNNSLILECKDLNYGNLESIYCNGTFLSIAYKKVQVDFSNNRLTNLNGYRLYWNNLSTSPAIHYETMSTYGAINKVIGIKVS